MLIFHICAIFEGIYRKQECLCFELDNKVEIIMKLDGVPYLEYRFHSSDISFCGFFYEDETIFYGQGTIRCHYRWKHQYNILAILFIENLSRSDYIHDVIVRTDRISLQLGLIVFQAILLIEIKMTDTLATNVKASFDERINWWAPDSDVSTCCSFNCAHVFENQTGLFAHFATLYIKKGNRNCVKRVMNVIRRI